MAEQRTVNQKIANATSLVVIMGIAGSALLNATLDRWEGNRPEAYLDVVNVATACRGVTKGVTIGRTYSAAECERMNETETVKHVQGVLAATPQLAYHPYQLAAASSLTYNIGIAGYARSTVARRFNAGDWRGACDAFLMWNKAGGRVVPGLTKRREAERELCLKELPR